MADRPESKTTNWAGSTEKEADLRTANCAGKGFGVALGECVGLIGGMPAKKFVPHWFNA